MSIKRKTVNYTSKSGKTTKFYQVCIGWNGAELHSRFEELGFSYYGKRKGNFDDPCYCIPVQDYDSKTKKQKAAVAAFMAELDEKYSTKPELTKPLDKMTKKELLEYIAKHCK